MNLEEAMRRRGLNPYDLEDRTSVAASNIYAIKSGAKVMGEKVATKLGQELGVDPDLLRIGNQGAAMSRAMKRNDAHGVLTAARTIVKITEKRTLTPESERFLDELVDKAVKVATGYSLDFEDDEAVSRCPRANKLIRR
jgi:hypothetical protein